MACFEGMEDSSGIFSFANISLYLDVPIKNKLSNTKGDGLDYLKALRDFRKKEINEMKMIVKNQYQGDPYKSGIREDILSKLNNGSQDNQKELKETKEKIGVILQKLENVEQKSKNSTKESEQTISELKDQIKTGESEIFNLNKRISESENIINNNIQANSNRLNSLESFKSKATIDINNVKTKTQINKLGISNLENKTEQLKEYTERNIKTLSDNDQHFSKLISSLESEVDNIHDRIDITRDDIEKAFQAISKVNNTLTEVSKEVSRIGDVQAKELAHKEAEKQYVASKIKNARQLYTDSSLEIVTKWYKNDYDSTGLLIEDAEESLRRGFHTEVYSKLERFYDNFEKLAEKANKQEEDRLILKEKAKRVYKSLQLNGCAKISMMSVNKSDPASSVAVGAVLPSGKKIMMILDMMDKIKVRIDGVGASEAHSVFDVIVEVFGGQGLIAPHVHEHKSKDDTKTRLKLKG